MSYYILPKNYDTINVNPQYSDESISPYLSLSLLNYYNKIENQINLMFQHADLSDNTFDEAIKLINPYEFIFSSVPGSKFSVSKLKHKTNLFYDLLEIYNNLNIFEEYNSCDINSLHISSNNDDSIECFGMIREKFNDKIMFYNSDENIVDDLTDEIKLDFIFYEINTKNYFLSIMKLLLLIIKNQSYNGTTVFKISDSFHKISIETFYLLSSLYKTVHVCKPNTNNITTFDKYIVCKNFIISNDTKDNYLRFNYLKLLVFIKKINNKNISRILDFDVPYYFKNKIDDINIIIGQQQIDALDQIIFIYKNKSKDDKIEIIKKNNIHKSVVWCEKHKIPCNKFTEKTNIFLPIINSQSV
jgi:hypothetical protein